MRRTCRRDAGRPADINHRCAFRSSHSLYSGLVQGRLQVELLQPLSSNRSRLTVGKRDSSNKASWIQKKKVSESYPESCPNHTRIVPQTSQFWTLVHLQDQNLCFVSSFCNHSPRATLRLLLLLSKIRQQHPAAASCNGTNMPTPKRTHHFNCSTLKQHPAAAPPASSRADTPL